jgi:Mo-co oxidoreductase dimerisation domain
VSAVDVSFDFGASWQAAELEEAGNPFAWQNWRAAIELPRAGYCELWARATDDGRMQPFAVAWNPRGYISNAIHRIALTVPG